MNNKSLLLTLTLSFTVILFVGVSFVWSQTGFIEPGAVTDLPVPLSTSDAPQTIDSVLGVGVTTEAQIPNDVGLFVLGDTITKDGPFRSTGVAAINSLAGNKKVLNIQGSQVGIGEACPNDARVCVVENNNARRAVYVVQEKGIGIFGETQAAGKAGVYGVGYYGVYGLTDVESAIPVVGQSCTENQGSCIAPYGTAGFFDGDLVVQKDLGVITGDGRNLYRVGSLYNKEEDYYTELGVEGVPTSENLRSGGVAYKSYGVFNPITLDAVGGANDSASYNAVINNGDPDPKKNEQVVSIMVVEGNGSSWWPARDVTVQYQDSIAQIVLTNTSVEPREVQVLVTYLLSTI